MNKKRPPRVEYQESGGGWGNPLLGRVFDSNKDLPEDEREHFAQLVEQCDLSNSGQLEGRPPTDTTTFELRVEENDDTVKVVGDMQRADDKLRALVSFIRKHSRKEILK